MRVDARVRDQAIRVLPACVTKVAERVGFEDRRVRVGHYDGTLDGGLIEQLYEYLRRVEPAEGFVLVDVCMRVDDVHGPTPRLLLDSLGEPRRSRVSSLRAKSGVALLLARPHEYPDRSYEPVNQLVKAPLVEPRINVELHTNSQQFCSLPEANRQPVTTPRYLITLRTL